MRACVRVCVFALGRRLKEKQCFVMLWVHMQRVIHRTHTHETRLPSQVLLTKYSSSPICLPLMVSLTHTHMYTLMNTQTHTPRGVSSFSFPFPGHWPVFRSGVDGSLGSSGFFAQKQREQTQLWNQTYDSVLNPCFTWRVSGCVRASVPSLKSLSKKCLTT